MGNTPSEKTSTTSEKYEYGYLGNWYIKLTIYKKFLYSN